jgi:uncharacterized protein YecA (UPF0149 family)
MENIDSDALEKIGEMMGQDRETMNRIKQMMKNPEAVKQMKKMLNKALPASNNFPEKKEKIGRNDLCLCGSGKKYKKCCMLSEN